MLKPRASAQRGIIYNPLPVGRVLGSHPGPQKQTIRSSEFQVDSCNSGDKESAQGQDDDPEVSSCGSGETPRFNQVPAVAPRYPEDPDANRCEPGQSQQVSDARRSPDLTVGHQRPPTRRAPEVFYPSVGSDAQTGVCSYVGQPAGPETVHAHGREQSGLGSDSHPRRHGDSFRFGMVARVPQPSPLDPQ